MPFVEPIPKVPPELREKAPAPVTLFVPQSNVPVLVTVTVLLVATGRFEFKV